MRILTVSCVEPEKFSAARRLMTHAGVRPLTAPAFVLIIGHAERVQCGKQVASYLGLVPIPVGIGEVWVIKTFRARAKGLAC
jgi:hypothetical protein